LFIILSAFSQTPPDSCRLRISLVTCGPGEDLYSIFGHTGIRVTDSTRNTDIVFNYGTFDDSDPYFYLKFTRGIMRYSLSIWPYSAFMEEYRVEQRRVAEQVLNLDCREKRQLFNALLINAQENNRYYNYQFHVDNCTTRAKNMITNNKPVHFGNMLPPQHPSFRQLIHSCLNQGKQYWSKLAIDLLLGAHLDATVTNEQAMFLPDYLAKGLDSAHTDSGRLVSETVPLLTPAPKTPPASWCTPLNLFSALLIIIAALSFIPSAQKAVYVFDRVLFLLTGLLGIVMWAVWITRVDTVCSNNWNTLWALPTHAVMAFLLSKKRPWIRIYWIITSALLALLLMGWLWWPQQLNNDLLPLVLLLLLRSVAAIRRGSKTGL